MKNLLILILLGSTNLALASSSAINSNIIKYGLYAITMDNGKSWVNPVTDEKVHSQYPEPIHIKTTAEVPAVTPLFFGFEYHIEGLPDGLTEITTNVSHPPIKSADGKVSTGYNEQHKYLVLEGKLTSLTGYILENKNELTPGEWRFSVNYKGKELVSRKFIVVE